MKKTFLTAFAATLAATSAFAITANADFAKTKIYTDGQFTDVPATEWYADSVKEAYEFGIMNGNSATTFAPDGTLTVAEGITVAARLYSTMTEKEIIKLAEKMRQAQKDYFATRSRADLTAAKSLEKQLDEAIREYNQQNPQLLIDIFTD